ncbi:MAG: HPr family phosphocarrier protein [Lachnospiraceae bacterium]|nr:HPr family phosphocarrier protein [Lachnospiraceae bacterium]
MKERKIRLPEISDAKKFVSAASKCEFDIDVFYNRVVIDAKSLLEVLSLDLSRELTVQYGGDDLQFEDFLNHYTTA